MALQKHRPPNRPLLCHAPPPETFRRRSSEAAAVNGRPETLDTGVEGGRLDIQSVLAELYSCGSKAKVPFVGTTLLFCLFSKVLADVSGRSLGHQGVFDLWPCYSISCAGLAVSDGFCGVSINFLFIIYCMVLDFVLRCLFVCSTTASQTRKLFGEKANADLIELFARLS